MTHFGKRFEIRGPASGKVHYRGHSPACGAPTPSYGGIATNPAKVDCRNCMRTRAYKDADHKAR